MKTEVHGIMLAGGILLTIAGVVLYAARRPRAGSRAPVVGKVVDRALVMPVEPDEWPKWWLTVEWSGMDGLRHQKEFLVDNPTYKANPEGSLIEVTLLDPERPERVTLATVQTFGGDPRYTLPMFATTLGVLLIWAAFFLPEPGL